MESNTAFVPNLYKFEFPSPLGEEVMESGLEVYRDNNVTVMFPSPLGEEVMESNKGEKYEVQFVCFHPR